MDDLQLLFPRSRSSIKLGNYLTLQIVMSASNEKAALQLLKKKKTPHFTKKKQTFLNVKKYAYIRKRFMIFFFYHGIHVFNNSRAFYLCFNKGLFCHTVFTRVTNAIT